MNQGAVSSVADLVLMCKLQENMWMLVVKPRKLRHDMYRIE